MSHYLAEMGWEITVCAPENPDYPQIDEQLNSKVHPNITVVKVSGFEPRKIASFMFPKRQGKKRNLDNSLDIRKKHSFLQRGMIYVRGNYFIPDARVFWAKAVKKHFAKQNCQFDVVISSGPPHSAHLAGRDISNHFSLPFIADFRDPWMEIEYFDKLKITAKSKEKHRRLEQLIMKSASVVTTVSPSWAELFKSKGAKRTEVVFNGFEPVQFADESTLNNELFSIVHTGTLGPDRMVPAFSEGLKNFIDSEVAASGQVRVEFAGNTSDEVKAGLENIDLERIVDHGFVPHQEALNLTKKAGLLLLIQNNAKLNILGRVPSKFFEYVATGNPILIIGNTSSDLAQIVKNQPGIYVVDFLDTEGIERSIREAFNFWKNKDSMQREQFVEQFTRKTAAIKMDGLLREFVK
jgi:hypothetical protein